MLRIRSQHLIEQPTLSADQPLESPAVIPGEPLEFLEQIFAVLSFADSFHEDRCSGDAVKRRTIVALGVLRHGHRS